MSANPRAQELADTALRFTLLRVENPRSVAFAKLGHYPMNAPIWKSALYEKRGGYARREKKNGPEAEARESVWLFGCKTCKTPASILSNKLSSSENFLHLNSSRPPFSVSYVCGPIQLGSADPVRLIALRPLPSPEQFREVPAPARPTRPPSARCILAPNL